MKTLCARMVGLAVWLALNASATAAAPPRQGPDLAYDQVVQGHISADAPEQQWNFAGRADDLIMIDMRAGSSSLDSYLTLLGPDGSTLMTDDDGGAGYNSRIGPYLLPSTGQYTIVASNYNGEGDYRLELRNLSAIPVMVPFKPVIGVLSSEHLNDYFMVVGGEDTRLWRLEARDDNPNSDPSLAFYGANGLIANTELQENGAIDPLTQVPGETYIIVVSLNPNGAGGPYELALRESDAQLLADGVAQSGSLSYDTYSQSHYFRADADQTIRITVTAQGEIAPTLQVSSADYTTFLFSSDSQTTRELSITLTIPVATVYVAEVRDGSLAGNTGSYTILLEDIE
jgi:hypothetical protein